MWIIRLDQGDYLQVRGGWDWGRTTRELSTLFDDREDAEAWARMVGRIARVVAD